MRQINLRIPDELLERIEQHCGRNRNAYLTRILDNTVPGGNRPPEPTQTSRADMFRAANKRR